MKWCDLPEEYKTMDEKNMYTKAFIKAYGKKVLENLDVTTLRDDRFSYSCNYDERKNECKWSRRDYLAESTSLNEAVEKNNERNRLQAFENEVRKEVQRHETEKGQETETEILGGEDNG